MATNEKWDPIGSATNSQLMRDLGQGFGVENTRLLTADVEALKNQELAPSQTEKDQASQMAESAAAMQGLAQQTELGRNQMGGGGYTGQYAEASRGIGDVAAQTGATARAEQDELGRQQAEARRAEILGRVERQQEIGIDERRNQGDRHSERAESVASIFALMP
tara:strand:+ start:109 stop:600 length:492 start_codon:yes stop_codon:yes gene_type:complete